MTLDASDPIPSSALRWICDPTALGFETTAQLPDLEGFVGQVRATEALRYGVRVRDSACHLYVMGTSGTGRHALTRRMIASEAPLDSPPSDWCYVNRFKDPRRPQIVRLPAGKGPEFRKDMADLMADLDSALPAAFESDAYREQRARIDSEIEAEIGAAFDRIQAEATASGVALVQSGQGLTVVPMGKDEPMSREDFDALPQSRREAIGTQIERIGELLQKHFEQVPRWHRRRRQSIRDLDRRTASSSIQAGLADLKVRYADHPVIAAYLAEAENDLIENARLFRRRESVPPLAMFEGELARDDRKTRYAVNLLVENAAGARAPVVYESNPNYLNLFGSIENIAQFGTLTTDFTMVRAGALHRANGGYLIVDAERLLVQPFAWESLKRALFAREIRIESLAQQLSLISTVTLNPEPAPLEVRVVFVGSRQIYYLLSELDPDFPELFKVPVDVEDDVERTPESLGAYARLLATLARQQQMQPFDAAAVARLLEHAARLSGDTLKLSTRVRLIREVMREADFLAREARQPVVTRDHVEAALAQRERRLDRIKLRMQEDIHRAHRRIETDGMVAGQLNGLSIVELSDFAFAVPARITATVRVGDGEIVDIEREVELGGAIHSKGVLILSAFLASRYAGDTPLSLRASLVFEQSYGGVEGDSASLAELCALLSAIAGVPLRQSIAVTGSVDQRGQLQVVGGINEKIEGFFDVCAARGLSGEQGVIIPVDNLQHLMLKEPVVRAVAEGRFRLHAVRTVDEALVMLTGVAAGERGADGLYPPDSINRRVADRLQFFAQRQQAFARPARNGKSED